MKVIRIQSGVKDAQGQYIWKLPEPTASSTASTANETDESGDGTDPSVGDDDLDDIDWDAPYQAPARTPVVSAEDEDPDLKAFDETSAA